MIAKETKYVCSMSRQLMLAGSAVHRIAVTLQNNTQQIGKVFNSAWMI